MSLPEELLRRFPRLRDLPPGCYVVGGAVRDLLLGIEPADVDVAAPDPLVAAKTIASQVIRLGTEDHLSAWRVVEGELVYDFAAILDGDIGADLARRDFTVNAIAVSLEDASLLDPHHGREDLTAHVIRMIDPSNFDDDPLRCLKAVRMAVRFGFSIDPATAEAIRRRSGRIPEVAAERITYEMSVIFSAGAFGQAVRLLRDLALDVPIFGKEIAASFRSDAVPLAAAFALILDDPRAFGLRWRWSERLIREVETLQRLASMEGDRRIALYDAGEAISRQLPPMLRASGRDDRVEMPDFSIRALLSGEEIAGITALAPGPRLGAVKRELLEAQIRGEVRSRQEAEALVRRSAAA
jgi:hypothetical protein